MVICRAARRVRRGGLGRRRGIRIEGKGARVGAGREDGGRGADRQRIVEIVTVVRARGPPLHSHDGRWRVCRQRPWWLRLSWEGGRGIAVGSRMWSWRMDEFEGWEAENRRRIYWSCRKATRPDHFGTGRHDTAGQGRAGLAPGQGWRRNVNEVGLGSLARPRGGSHKRALGRSLYLGSEEQQFEVPRVGCIQVSASVCPLSAHVQASHSVHGM